MSPETGLRLFDAVCARDMEGVVAKLASGPYALNNRKSTP
jgi:ATP-dependent DNA ligase